MPTATRSSTRARIMGMPGVRSIRRPASASTPAFDLGYVRSGPRTGTPIVIIPGGPGLASVLPYQGLRKQASTLGLDVVMVEHRGVGLSRTDVMGADLPVSAMDITAVIDDINAVLEAEQIPRAIIFGSSYGTYLAQALGARYPNRVAAMVLDSPMIDANNQVSVLEQARAALWEGRGDGTALSARMLRTLVAKGTITVEEASEVARIVYEFAGAPVLEDLLRIMGTRGRSATWRWLAKVGRNDTERLSPFVMEFDLVGAIAFRQLNYAPAPDGLPFDPYYGFADVVDKFPAFSKEPFALRAALPGFTWPVVVLSGARDLRTSRAVAEEIVATVPDGTLIAVPDIGHSILDTHSRAALEILAAVQSNTHRQFADTDRVAQIRRSGSSRALERIIRLNIAGERLLPRRRATR